MIRAKFYKIISASLLLFCIVGATVPTGTYNVKAEVPVTQKNNDKATVKGIIKNYFDAKYKMKSTLTYSADFQKYFLPESNSKSVTEEVALQAEIEHNKNQITDLTYKSYTYNLNYKNITVDENSAKISVEENCDIYFSCTPYVKSEIKGLVHDIILKKVDNKWLIVADNYENDFKTELEQYTKNNVPVEQAKESFIQETKKQVQQIKKIQNTPEARKMIRDTEKTVQKSLLGYTFNNYDWQSAVSYAKTWALGMNTPRWFNYESMGGDCTNFISQCLYAGGIPADATGSYQWYWYSDGNRASAWTGASQFLTYATNNNTASSTNYGLRAVESNWGSMYQGDIVQLGSTPTHSMFISSVVYSTGTPPTRSDYLVCQHSIDASGRKKNIPLSSKTTPEHYLSIKGYCK
jgi:hypothetical protein